MTVEARNTIASVTFTVSAEAEYTINFPFLNNPENLSIWYRTDDGSIQYLELNSDVVVDTYDGTNGVFGIAYLDVELEEGTKFTIERNITNDQNTTFTSQTVLSTPMEEALDKLTLIDQDLNFRDQTLRVPASEKITNPDQYELASSEARLNTVLGIKNKELVYYDIFAGGGILPATHNTLGLVQIGESLDVTESGEIDVPFADSSRAGIVQIGTGFSVEDEAIISVDETKIDEAQENADLATSMGETALAEAQASKTESLDALSEANDAKTKSAEALSVANTSQMEATEALGLMAELQRTTTATLDLVSEALTDSSEALADVNQKKSDIETIKANIDAVKALTVQTEADANTLSGLVAGVSVTVGQALTDSANAKSTAESEQLRASSALSQVNTEKEYVNTIASDIDSIASEVDSNKASVDSIASSISTIKNSIDTIYSEVQTSSTLSTQAKTSADAFLTRANTEATTAQVIVDAVSGDWQLFDVLADAAWTCVTFGNGRFVTVRRSSSVSFSFSAWSDDGGETFNVSSIPQSQGWNNIEFGEVDGVGYFVVVSRLVSSVALWSNDGEIWNSSTMPRSTNWGKIAYGNEVFIAIHTTSSGTFAARSTDGGRTWSEITISLQSFVWADISFNNGIWVIVSSNSKNISYSTDDGLTWTVALNLPNALYFVQGGYIDEESAGHFVGLPINGTAAAYSPDGINWYSSTLPISATWYDIAYGNGVFCAIGYISNLSAPVVILSNDFGQTWEVASAPSNGKWQNITYGAGRFLMVETEVPDSASYARSAYLRNEEEIITIPEAINSLLEGR